MFVLLHFDTPSLYIYFSFEETYSLFMEDFCHFSKKIK